MTLYPWPQHDDASTSRLGVWWKCNDSARRGLLTDSLAVPLRFAPELHDDSPARGEPDVTAAATAQRDAALQRVRRIENLLAVRDLMQR